MVIVIRGHDRPIYKKQYMVKKPVIISVHIRFEGVKKTSLEMSVIGGTCVESVRIFLFTTQFSISYYFFLVL